MLAEAEWATLPWAVGAAAEGVKDVGCWGTLLTALQVDDVVLAGLVQPRHDEVPVLGHHVEALVGE